MAIQVLFFGATAAITGQPRIKLELVDEKASRMFEKILKDYPALGSHRLLFSINQQYASGNEVVRDGDELAVFTAVSGG